VSLRFKIDELTWAHLMVAASKHGIYLEGKLLRLIDPCGSAAAKTYLAKAISIDRGKRQDRLDFTKPMQVRNEELEKAQNKNGLLMEKLKDALEHAESARAEAEEQRLEADVAREEAEKAWQTATNDLDFIQRKTQFQLVGNIVRSALLVIIGVGATTTVLYASSLFIIGEGSSTTLLGNTWSNMFGILLTNSFSIIGTIMGVKYATDGGAS
jgi:hypothetical protein